MSSAIDYRVGKPPLRRTQTCDICKARHQKCSGAQPQCNNCELRGIGCSYSAGRAGTTGPSRRPHELIFPPSAGAGLRPSISSSDYARLYSQIFDDIVRDFNLQGSPYPGVPGEAFAPGDDFDPSRLRNASLPSFYREVSTLVNEQVVLDNGETTSRTNADSSPTSQLKALALEGNPEHARKILRDSLPTQEVSQRLLDLFFNYQNSIFFVCTMNEAKAQLDLMYENPSQVSVSWFCQMFLIFSVAVQFDDIDEDAVMYYEIGKKYMDDAIEENPQNTIWVVRAMLLLCFYQPPTKWTSIWMYLDAAIRGSQRFQLDLGQNQLKELSDEEYHKWRQLWLTIISFDRWVAIFLGRLPRIKESISRDPIFKGPPFPFSPECCVLQSNITTLAIISGNILRDIYFSEELRLSICRQYKNELDTWTANLPNPIREHVESGVFWSLLKDQAEATRNLHFMLLGARMLLSRPLLLKAIKSGMSSTRFTSPIVSAITSDAGSCITYAFQLISSADAMLSVPIPPKSLFIPVFFLINAANILILAAVWKHKQRSSNSLPPTTTIFSEQSPELAAIDAGIRVLDFCGQRNAFARKYAILIKELRLQLHKCISPAPMMEEASSRSTSRVTSEMRLPYNRSPMSVSLGEFSEASSSSINTPFTSLGQGVTPMETSGGADTNLNTNLGFAAAGIGAGGDRDKSHWSEQFDIFHPNDDVDISSYDSMNLTRNDEEGMDFLNNLI